MQALLSFLEQLEANNDKRWMDQHRDIYKQARTIFTDFVQNLIDRRAEFDKSLPLQTMSQTVFRINRDIRFAKNKQPYKPFMA